MKKYLLSLLVVGLSFIGFSNGYTFECNFNNALSTNCTPATISYDLVNNSTNTINGNPNAQYTFYYINTDDSSYMIKFDCTNNICTNTPNFEYDDLFEYDFNFTQAICIEPGNDGVPSNDFCNQRGGGNEGGDTGGGDTGGGDTGGDTGGNGSDLGLISHLTPAVNGLWDTVVELIPYIVYIGIGVLLFTLGFYAIRRLVNWLSGKINSNFKSKR